MERNKLKKIIVEIFKKHKLSTNHSKICADAIINAEIVGAHSHGLSRLKMYCDRTVSYTHLTLPTILLV